MDDDDIIDDECENDETSDIIIDIDYNENINVSSGKKRGVCSGLYSTRISTYIDWTPAKFGSFRRVEVIAKELWKNKFKKEFSRKKLNLREKRILNQQIYAKSTWFIDRESKIS